ncbi:MAG: MFS transporter [Holosporales bacterium]|jgi:MFS family permease|nr:MFS transporter [Holosporales bacterium]
MFGKPSFFAFLKCSIPGTIWAIGVSSLLVNISTSIVFAGSALYLKTVLGVAVSAIGLLEAVVEAIAYGVRIFSGVISDYCKKRKFLLVIGFVMLALAKPFLGISRSFTGIFVARVIDRMGNGIQASPRDALVSDCAPKDMKGACFGLRQSLAVIGSTVGGLLGIVVMKLTGNNFELLFILAGIPAIVATVILIIFVKEKCVKKSELQRKKIKLKDLKLLGKKFWILMIVVMIFMLGRFGEMFISLHACSNFALDVAYGTAITLIYNLFATIISYPIGKLSDKKNRTTLLLGGFIALLLAHLLIGYAKNLTFVFCGTVLWGVQRGITEGLFATLVSDYVPKDLRGTGFGVYYLIISAATATASTIAGIISQCNGEASAFIVGAVFSCCAILTLLLCKKALATVVV